MKRILIILVIVVVLVLVARAVLKAKPKATSTGSGVKLPAAPAPQMGYIDYAGTFKQGVQGSEVKVLQEYLQFKGKSVAIEGYLGPQTAQMMQAVFGKSQVSEAEFETKAKADKFADADISEKNWYEQLLAYWGWQ